MSADKFYEIYHNKGFYFPKSFLTTYCLSLFTKPLVILSGISGTGKTKMAQIFSVAESELSTKETEPAKPDPAANWIALHVTEGVLTGDGRANFKYGDLTALLSEKELEEIEPERNRLIKLDLTNNYSPFYDLIIETPQNDYIKAKFYLQRPQSPLVRVRFKSKRGEEDYDSRPYFEKNYKVGDIIKLEKIGDKRLRIISVNDEDVRDQYRKMEQDEKKLIDNKCFISVKSDWTDSSYLFGFYNLVDQKYQVTRLLKFILTAIENPNISFFLILDEMNLSKVEYYFSDFLSCLESRYYEDGEIIQEKIQLHAAAGFLETNDEYFDLISSSIEWPSNLFVTGTVNIDETTYMFSPKVLDRANVIEFNTVDFENYEKKIPTNDDDYVLKEFPKFSQAKLSTKQDFIGLKGDAKKVIKDIHSILEQYNMHFGFRTINEMSLFINNALKFIGDSATVLSKSIDFQIVQKILPKLHGGYSKLDFPLREIIKTLTESDKNLDEIDLEFVEGIKPQETKFPISVSKLQRIYKNLSVNGFASFVE